MIDEKYIQTCINELSSIKDTSDNKREVSLIETALFIEDIFTIVITDEEISTENLGNSGNLLNFIKKKYGV
ncbi:MAG: hypothetical protein JXJ04_05465 [Spirochaetales bacterium]|nr:hypothetical protein [Spirochaetales bacterium]